MLTHTFRTNGMNSTRMPRELAIARQLWDLHSPVNVNERMPRADVIETNDEIIVRLEMPGISAKDIDVSLEQDTLTVKAERNPPQGPHGLLYHRNELRYGPLERSFKLPNAVDRNDIHAAYTDGVLTITIPKAEDQKPRSIEVKSS